MKFALGYRRPENGEPFTDIVSDYRESIDEVFFPWVGIASGRPVYGVSGGKADEEARRVLEDDLRCLRSDGVRLDLLLNGNCYGERAVSRAFENEVLEVLEHLDSIGCRPQIVTTASFFVARTLKTHCPDIEVRASVNMRIGTIQAMEYASDYFDSFYIQRDIQRNIENVRRFHNWCSDNGKKLGMLANSGCLRFCPSQTFHDNLLAHSAGAEELENVSEWNPHLCHNLYASRENYANILKSTWIRPENMHLYEGLADIVKLATRQHSNPRAVIDAYSRGRCYGNLLELFEPGYAYAFSPYCIDNRAFPKDWSEHVTRCPGDCTLCNYCDTVLPQVLKKCNFNSKN